MAACIFSAIGWGSTSGERNDGRPESREQRHQDDRDNGNENAERTHQGNDEDVKRAQGDESGRKDIHDNKSHQDEEQQHREERS